MTGTESFTGPGNGAHTEGIDIRLADFVPFVRRNRRRLLVFSLVGAILAGGYAALLPNQYSSQVTVMPEIQSKTPGGSLGGLSSLAGLAGVDLGSLAGGGGSDAIRPDLYPNVLQSMPFGMYLLKQPVYYAKVRKTMSLAAFLKETQPFPALEWFIAQESLPLDSANTSRALVVSEEQERLIRTLGQQVGATYDKKTGILTIQATLADPVVTATVARLSLDYLADYITSYRTGKAKLQVDFLAKRVTESRRRYQSAEYALESWRDRNRSLFTNVAKLEEQRLQADFLLAQTVYNDLSKQLEQAKIKVQEETPVFKTLEPPRVPLRKSAPKRMVMVLVGALLGLLVGLGTAAVSALRSKSAPSSGSYA